MTEKTENMIETKLAVGAVVVAYLFGVRRGRTITLRSLNAIAKAVKEA